MGGLGSWYDDDDDDDDDDDGNDDDDDDEENMVMMVVWYGVSTAEWGVWAAGMIMIRILEDDHDGINGDDGLVQCHQCLGS